MSYHAHPRLYRLADLALAFATLDAVRLPVRDGDPLDSAMPCAGRRRTSWLAASYAQPRDCRHARHELPVPAPAQAAELTRARRHAAQRPA